MGEKKEVFGRRGGSGQVARATVGTLWGRRPKWLNTTYALTRAATYPEQLGPLHCLYLLNDNVELQGLWFDYTRWLEHAWLP